MVDSLIVKQFTFFARIQ